MVNVAPNVLMESTLNVLQGNIVLEVQETALLLPQVLTQEVPRMLLGVGLTGGMPMESVELIVLQVLMLLAPQVNTASQ